MATSTTATSSAPPTLLSLPPDALELVMALLPSSESLAAAVGCCTSFWSIRAAAASARAAQLGWSLPADGRDEPCTLALKWVELVARPLHTSIAAGGGHTVALGLERPSCAAALERCDVDDRVMAWGGDPDDFNNHISHLGHGRLLGEPAGLPKAVVGLEAATGPISVAAGDYVSVLLTERGECWSWGRPDCHLLGRHEPDEEAEQYAHRAKPPRRIAAAMRVEAVACGASHSLLLAGGRLHSWGWGECGALGHGERRDEPEPRRLEGLQAVRHFGAGDAFSLAVGAARGELWAWGDGEYGRLGLGIESGARLVPVPVPAVSEAPEDGGAAPPPRFVRCCGARNHSLAVCARGGAFSFGSGELGVLGHGECGDRLLPSRVAALRGECIVEVAAGWHHSAFLDSRGRVHTCGLDGGQGVLGHADRFVDEELQLRPRVVASLLSERVVEVACGAHHTVVRTRHGALLTFGEGRKGALGTGGFESRCEPLRVLDKLEIIARLQRERDALVAKLRLSGAEASLQELSLAP